MLPKRGKEVLIKIVAEVILIYSMSCFKISIALYKELGNLMAKFCWDDQIDTRNIHWIS